MADKKEIVLQKCKNAIDCGEPITDYGFYYEVIAMLKEQEGTISELQNAYDYLKKQFFEAQDKQLKEQEAVPVIQREVMHMLVWCCGSCGVAITDGDKYCRMCGKKVEWNA
jgi:rubrerythrin